MLDLRRMFDKYRIVWKDKGSNCSRGNLNISCPFCRTDPSYHLAVAEDGSAYYCFRDSNHSGRNLNWLFTKLKIPTKELDGFFFSNKKVFPEVKSIDSVYSWHLLTKAIEDDEALEYLSFRKFSAPIVVCTMFSLLTQPDGGKWAGRLIIPLTVGWTGRSIRPHIEPRYLANTNQNGFFAYSNSNTSCIVVEGAFDAMRIASSNGNYDVVAKCGNRLSPALLSYLRDKNYMSLYDVPDADVPIFKALAETRQLDSYCMEKRAKNIGLPTGIKDVCEMDEDACCMWLSDKYFWTSADSFSKLLTKP